MKLSAQQVIDQLGLAPLLGEGGFYRESYRASERLAQAALPARYQSDKPFGSAIYYLLTPETCSKLHRLPTDEIYHFYLGDPVSMLLLHPDGRAQAVTLGPDILAGQQVQYVVPGGVWQGARLVEGGAFALMGTTMAPSFGPEDFEPGDRAQLAAQYPQRAGEIAALTACA